MLVKILIEPVEIGEPARCTGHCCKMFPLPYPLDEVKRRQKFIVDGEAIAAMLIPLDRAPERGFHWFTCHHLSDNGDCRIYDQRPGMCSEYPYDPRGVCVNEGCTAAAPDDPLHAVTTTEVDPVRIWELAELRGLDTAAMQAALQKEYSDDEFTYGLCPHCQEWVVEQRAAPGVVGRHNEPGSWREVSPGVSKPKVCPGAFLAPKRVIHPNPAARRDEGDIKPDSSERLVEAPHAGVS